MPVKLLAPPDEGALGAVDAAGGAAAGELEPPVTSLIV
jgi:hypothetical protein